MIIISECYIPNLIWYNTLIEISDVLSDNENRIKSVHFLIMSNEID